MSHPWNPRYVAYAKAHGKTPEQMMEQDGMDYPGGCMAGYIVWIGEQTETFRARNPEAFLNRHTIGDQSAFTTFLMGDRP
jgi:hypothetical protein